MYKVFDVSKYELVHECPNIRPPLHRESTVACAGGIWQYSDFLLGDLSHIRNCPFCGEDLGMQWEHYITVKNGDLAGGVVS